MDLLKSFKNLIGINENVDENELDEFEDEIDGEEDEDEEIELEDKPKQKFKFGAKDGSDKIDPNLKNEAKSELKPEIKNEAKGEVKKEVKREEELDENCHTIFIDPHSFLDCKKIADYIKKDRMVTLNLEYLDTDTAQRMMDFIMGAMIIKEANFIEISKKVYTSVPKAMKVHYDGRKVSDRAYMGMK